MSPWVRDAITDSHGAADVGRIALFLVMWVVLGVIPIMAAGAVIEACNHPVHIFPYAELGKGIGLVTAAFAAALGALGVYIAQDKKPTAPLPADAPPSALPPVVPQPAEAAYHG
jgi:hypothetical protein